MSKQSQYENQLESDYDKAGEEIEARWEWVAKCLEDITDEELLEELVNRGLK